MMTRLISGNLRTSTSSWLGANRVSVSWGLLWVATAVLVWLPARTIAAEGDGDLTANEGRVGGAVFLDTDADGIYDENEQGVEGIQVTLELVTQGGELPGAIGQTTTDARGEYWFLVDGLSEDSPIRGLVSVTPGDQLQLTTDNPSTTGWLVPGVEDYTCLIGLVGGGGDDSTTPLVAEFQVEHAVADSGLCVDVPVLLSTSLPVEGFVTAMRHDPALSLDEVTIEGTVTEANGADFVSVEVLPEGGTAGIVMDLQPPFDGNTIPAGDFQPVVVYRYCCPTLPPGGDALVYPLELVDSEIGSPAKDNVVVVGGMSYTPVLSQGSVTCAPPPPVVEEVTFLVGGPELDPDNRPVPLSAEPGATQELTFYYVAPDPGPSAPAGREPIQGLAMVLALDCSLEVIESSFGLPADSIPAVAGAEYISFQADNDPDDGDGCEIVLAILMEAEAPLEDKVLPLTDVPLKIASVDVRSRGEVPCGQCLTIQFADGLNGTGKIPHRNVYSAANTSFTPKVEDTVFCVTGVVRFLRGDCNQDGKVNTTDAVNALRYLFPSWSGAYLPPCLDACDSDDSGSINVSDAIRVMQWLIQRGTPPAPPGPYVPGEDPSEDGLTCDLDPSCP